MSHSNGSMLKEPARKPLVGYLRLTVDRDGNKIGYDKQQREILKWADYAGETIGRWYKDKDVTAADHNVKRESYEQMLEDIEAGDWGGIVVWRLDRLVRLTFEFERVFKLVNDTHGRIIALDPSILDSSEEMGALFMRLLVMFAQLEIDTMKARARAHRQERAVQGHANGGGPRPFGFVGAIRDSNNQYVNVGKVGVEHLPEEVALIREAADRILIDRWTFADVLKEWAKREPPVVGTTGRPMSVLTLQRILTSPRIVGKREATITDDDNNSTVALVQAKWLPILTEEQRERLLALITHRGKNGPKVQYLLSGIVQCECGHTLTGATRRYAIKGEIAGNRTYRCKSMLVPKQEGACGALNVIAEPVEKLVVARIVARLMDNPNAIALLNPDDGSDSKLEAAFTEIRELDEQLADFRREIALRKGVALSMLLASVEDVSERRQQAVRRAEKLSNRSRVPVPVGDDRSDMAYWFAVKLNLTQQRAVVGAVVSKIVILKTGRNGPAFNPDRVLVTFPALEDSDA